MSGQYYIIQLYYILLYQKHTMRMSYPGVTLSVQMKLNGPLWVHLVPFILLSYKTETFEPLASWTVIVS